MSSQVALAEPGYSQTLLRTGLTSIVPIRKIEKRKMWGQTFEIEYTTYEPFDEVDQEIKSYEEYIKTEYEFMLHHIEIPDRFDVNKLIHTLTEDSIKKYNEDEEIQQLEENIEKSGDMLSPMIDLIKLTKKRHEDTVKSNLQTNIFLVYESNIPFKFLSSFVKSDYLYSMFLNYLDNVFQYYDKRISTKYSRSNRIREKTYINQLKHDADTIFNIVEPLFFNHRCLKTLLIIWNANSYEEILDPKTFNYDLVPHEYFELIHNGFRNNMKDVRYYIKNTKYGTYKRPGDISMPKSKLDFKNYLKDIFIENVPKM